MPEIIYNAHDRTGDCYIKFSNKRFEFYGAYINQTQAFRYYGNLPDNEVLVNKLINTLGRNLITLEKESLEITQNPTSMSESLKEKVVLHSKMERESNAFNIRIFDCLASLEQNRKPTSDYRKALHDKIKTLYKERIGYLDTLLIGITSTTKRNEIEGYKRQIENSREALLKTIDDSNNNVRRIYRQVMENFADEQRIISVYQHTSARPLTYANRSLTEAYQNASYAMENHLFSIDIPKDKQLWSEVAVPEAIQINTALYSSMRKKDALYSACLIENPETAFKVSEEAIKQIQNTSRKNRALEKNKKRSSSDEYGFTVFECYLDTFKPYSTEPQSTPAIRELVSEEKVRLYQYKDLFSAIGIACSETGKYLESEMGAKKPVLTMATFIAMSASFGAAGLAAAGSTSAHTALGAFSKILTANGHIGVSPEQCQSIIQSISNTWSHMTYSSGSMLHTLIMNVSLSNLGFWGFDKLLNGAEHRDLLSQMAEGLKKQDLLGKTTEEERYTIAKNILIMSTLLVLGVGLGLSADYLTSIPGVAQLIGTGMSSFFHTPLEVFTAMEASSLPAALMAITSLALIVQSSTTSLTEIILLLDSINIKDAPKNAACIFMAALKATIEYNPHANLVKKLPLNQDETKEYYANFQQAINENPELIQHFGPKFLNEIGIQVPKPSLITRIETTGTTILNKLNKYLVKGVLLPIGQIIIAPVSLPLYRFAGVDLGTVKTLLSFGNAISRIGIGALAVGKLLALSTWGTLQRLSMAAVDTAFGVTLSLNSILRGGLKGIGWGIRGLFEKPLVNAASILSDVVRFSLGILKYSVGVSLGAIVTGPVSGIIGLIKRKGLEEFKKGFMLPLSFSDSLRKGCQSVKTLCANEVDRINSNILKAPSSTKIQSLRNSSVANVGYGFNLVKVGFGFLAYRARSIFIRSQENIMQAHLKKQEEDEEIKKAATKVADNAARGKPSTISANERALIDINALLAARTPITPITEIIEITPITVFKTEEPLKVDASAEAANNATYIRVKKRCHTFKNNLKQANNEHKAASEANQTSETSKPS